MKRLKRKSLDMEPSSSLRYSLSCSICMVGDAWLWSLQPISLQDTTLKEYSVKGSTTLSMLMLNMKELPVVIRELAVRFSMDSTVVLMLSIRKMKISTGLLPSKVGVHLTATQRAPKVETVTLDGTSGRSKNHS